MMVAATAANIARAQIIRDTGTLLTISIPDEPLPVHLIADPPAAARLVELLNRVREQSHTSDVARQKTKGA